MLWNVLEVTQLFYATGNYRMRREKEAPRDRFPILTEPEVSQDDDDDDHNSDDVEDVVHVFPRFVLLFC